MTVVPPVYVLLPERVNVPVPTLARAAPLPPYQLLTIWPLKVELVFSEPTCQVVVRGGIRDPQRTVAVELADRDRPAVHLPYR